MGRCGGSVEEGCRNRRELLFGCEDLVEQSQTGTPISRHQQLSLQGSNLALAGAQLLGLPL